ncbi:putative CAF1 family ribonuclease [Trypanosoma vivax]|nr:putative ribonuclease [Trypanosoma vivax]KAH8613619.1 putative CAF1 family ribonuclease [Trypanosoma vivax]
MIYITSQNFAQLFPEFLNDLSSAVYVAVDLEFTGIDRTSSVNFLSTPSERFKHKIEAARRFSPMQIGFSLFTGDALLGDGDMLQLFEEDKRASGVTSHLYRDEMIRQAREFTPVHSATKPLANLLMSMASKGEVTPEIMEEMHQIKLNLQSRCAFAEGKCIYDELSAHCVLDEAMKAIAIAERWKRQASSPHKQVFVKSYYFYLFPCKANAEVDRELSVSSETMLFLRNNMMDLNKWVSEGLRFCFFEDYAEACRTALKNASTKSLDFCLQLDQLKQWIASIQKPNVRQQLLYLYEDIEHFVLHAKVGETSVFTLPYLYAPLFNELDSLLQPFGMCVKQQFITKNSQGVRNDSTVSDERYFGTRLLLAFITTMRERKIPLVLHNGFSDLAFLYCMLHRDTPQSLAEFKGRIREMFPVIYDTRALTCVPSLQNIQNMTGPLKKTYINLRSRNVFVNINYSGSTPCPGDTAREHDACFDSFMTGSLFAFVQYELAKVRIDYRRLLGIVPVHGSIFNVNFMDDNSDCIHLPPQSPVYALRRRPNQQLAVESLRNELCTIAWNIYVVYNNEDCLLAIILNETANAARGKVNAVVRNWCETNGYVVTALDVESRVRACGITYISERAP